MVSGARGATVAGLAVIVTALMFAVGRAYAQPPSQEAVAIALFDEGRQLMAAGKYADAIPKFLESLRLHRSVGALLNVAECYQSNGQTASAWARFREAGALARDSHDSAREKVSVLGRAASLEPKLSKLVITVPKSNEVPDLEIKRDGAVINRAEWGLAIPVDPGIHPVEASAPHYATWTTSVIVGPETTQNSVTVPVLARVDEATSTNGPTPPPSIQLQADNRGGAPTGEQSHRGDGQRIAGLVVGGVGVVGLAVGTIFGLKASSTENDAESHCRPSTTLCDSTGVSLGDDAKHAATISTIGFVLGAAAVAGGVVLYLTAPKSTSTDSVHGQTPRSSGLALRMGPSVGGMAMTLGGAW